MSHVVFLMAQRLQVPIWAVSARMRELGLVGDLRYRSRSDGTDWVTVDLSCDGASTMPPEAYRRWHAHTLAQFAEFLANHAKAVQLILQHRSSPEVDDACEVRACDLPRLLAYVPEQATVMVFVRR